MTRATIIASTYRSRQSLLLAACVAMGASLSSGCASAPEPTSHLVAARQAVSEAERAQAVEHAAEIMTESRTRLALAEAAVNERRMADAARLADEARVDAELASAQAAAAKAEAANEEIRRATRTMIEEMQRAGSGGTP